MFDYFHIGVEHFYCVFSPRWKHNECKIREHKMGIFDISLDNRNFGRVPQEGFNNKACCFQLTLNELNNPPTNQLSVRTLRLYHPPCLNGTQTRSNPLQKSPLFHAPKRVTFHYSLFHERYSYYVLSSWCNYQICELKVVRNTNIRQRYLRNKVSQWCFDISGNQKNVSLEMSIQKSKNLFRKLRKFRTRSGSIGIFY